MTLPSERSRAVHNTKQFLYDLLDRTKTPRVPEDIRKRAYQLLKHYPGQFDIDHASDKAPDIFGLLDPEKYLETFREAVREVKKKQTPQKKKKK